MSEFVERRDVEQSHPNIELRIEWQAAGAPQFVVEERRDGHIVVIDPGLSAGQVERAIIDLGPLGPRVFHEWRRRMTVNQGSMAT